MLHPPEVGTHFIGKAGQPVQELGIIPEHFIILCILVDNVMIHFSPAFLKQGSALDFDILPLVLDNIVERTVDAVGNDFNLFTVIYFAVTCSLIGSGTLCHIIVVRIIIKILKTILNI